MNSFIIENIIDSDHAGRFGIEKILNKETSIHFSTLERMLDNIIKLDDRVRDRKDDNSIEVINPIPLKTRNYHFFILWYGEESPTLIFHFRL